MRNILKGFLAPNAEAYVLPSADDITFEEGISDFALPSLDEEEEFLPFEEPADSQLFEAVMGLDEKYRIVVHMFYYEDYDIREIAQILRCPSGTVKSRLSRARALLKDRLKEDWNND